MYDLNEEINKAKRVDPDLYLQSKGFEVKKEGKHYSIKLNGEEVFRTTKKDDGYFVTCDKAGNGIGDNISLVKNIEGCSFKEAISIINKTNYINNISSINQNNNQISSNEKKEEIKLPMADVNIVNSGRKYLLERGIELEVILKSEKENFIRYANDTIFFVGYDGDGKIKNVTKRSTNVNDEIQKRDLKGSDKYYPQILKGSEKSVWVVEGGVDALAAHSLALRLNKEAPTIIVTGGANVLAPFKNLEIQELLKKAEKVVIALENEKSIKVQTETDKAHQKQIEYINNVSPNKSICWKPPQTFKDLADYNQKIKKEQKISNNIEVKNNILLKPKLKLKM
jgi:hypothetical protein